MRTISRRQLLLRATLVTAGAVSFRVVLGQVQAEPRIIGLTARRFTYEPNEIVLKAGEKVVIAIQALDFLHGMNLPDLGMRLDLMPGRVTRLELQPKEPGVIDYLCDNFCGDGHEDMHGRFVVVA